MVRTLRNTSWTGMGGLLGLIVALLAFALVLTALSSGILGGAEFSPAGVKPEPLPNPPAELRTAIEAFRNRDWDVARRIIRTLPRPLTPDLEPTAMAGPSRVWSILIIQAAGDRELALTQWAHAQLPPNTELWRLVAIAAANLQERQLDDAAMALSAAEQLEPRNPLVSYYTGLYLLERAAAANDWPDALAIFNTRLAGFDAQNAPPWVMPNSASMFRLSAIQEFEAAIAHQADIDLGRPLVSAITPEELLVLPSVHDLLLTCGADRFVADAHSIISYLYLDRGNADAAERHLDQAAALGAVVIYGYDDVSRCYEAQHRYLPAARAAAKAVQHGPGRAGAAVRLFKNLGRLVEEAPRS